MNIEKQLVDALYKKIGGSSLKECIYSEDGKIHLTGKVRKRQIVRAVNHGCVEALIDLLIADPAMIGNFGTKRVRDGLGVLAKSHQKNGAELADSISRLLRANERYNRPIVRSNSDMSEQ